MSASLPFYKLQGAGNDFVAVDNRNNRFALHELVALTPTLCHRRFGVGADGLLALSPSDTYDYTMIYRNADGSDAGMCGNGARCIARMAHQLGFPARHRFEVHGHVYTAHVEPHQVTIDFPAEPGIESVPDATFGTVWRMFTGTDHVVVLCDASRLNQSDWLRQNGHNLRHDPRFAPAGTNVNFIALNGADSVRLVTYERGVEDLTLACGTGALAAALTTHNIHSNLTADPLLVPIESKVDIHCMGGLLQAGFRYDPIRQCYTNLVLTGPAEIVYNGEIQL